MLTKYKLLPLTMVMAAIAIIAVIACSPAAPETVEVTRVVMEQVEVEKVVEKEVEVEKVVEKQVEVPVTQIVEKVVEKEIEVTRVMMMEVPEGPKETIIFSDLNWTSAQVQNRIAQYIVEKGYGYPTDTLFGATLPLFQGLRAGDTHVTLEIWLPNQDEAWLEAQAAGEVVPVGETLTGDWQSAFVIPSYLQEQYPDLDSVEDLKEDQYKELFATAESGGKARLVSCVIGWACEGVNASQVTGYGLDDHVHIVNPGDSASGNADLYGAYERQEPWLGYQWGTNDPTVELGLTKLEEPAYSDACWFTTKACGYEPATVLIAVAPDLPNRAPDVVEMLRNWDFNIGLYPEIGEWRYTNPDATYGDTALWWLNSNIDLWTGWVTEEAATAVQAALSAGETPDGWPEE